MKPKLLTSLQNDWKERIADLGLTRHQFCDLTNISYDRLTKWLLADNMTIRNAALIETALQRLESLNH